MLLSAEEIEICKKKRGNHNRLAFGFMIVYFKGNINFPENAEDSKDLLMNVAAELEINKETVIAFEWNGRTVERFRHEIRNYLGYRDSSDQDAAIFVQYIMENILLHDPSDNLLMEEVDNYFRKQKLEKFKEKQLKRYISSAKHQFEQKILQSVYDQLEFKDRELIDKLLNQCDEERIIELSELKKDIPGARLKHVNYAIERIEFLRSIKIPRSTFKKLDRKVVLEYHDKVMALSPSNISEFRPVAKYSTMAIFFHIRLQIMLDSLADTFIKLVHRMRTKAAKHIDGIILKEVKKVEGKFDILEKLARASVNNPKGVIEDKVYTEVSREKLQELIKDLEHMGKWYQHQVQVKMHSNYVHGNRKVLLSILKILSLREDHEIYKPILEAVEFIANHSNINSNIYDIPPL